MSKARPRTIDVHIYDQKYSIVLKSSLKESEVRQLADTVDERMREIAAEANTADSLKVAVLTAMHLSLEIAELRRQCEQNDALIRSKANEWVHALDQVLKR